MSLMKKLVVVYRIKDKEKQLGLGGHAQAASMFQSEALD